MGKIAKRVVIAAVVVVVVFFAASFLIDRAMLGQTFERRAASSPNFLPTEEYAASYSSRPVEFQMDGQTLRGYVYEADNPRAFIVFRHGIFSQHCDYLALICDMVDRGYSVFAYDALGCGISDGDSTIGMAQSALDVAAAVDYVRESGLAGDLPLVLWGHSWGGYGVAAAMDIVPDVDACITMSGYNAPAEILVSTAVGSMGSIAATQAPTLWLSNKLVFGDDAERTAVDGINKTEASVLVIHGSADAVVPYETVAIIAQADRITNPRVEYLTMGEEGRNGHNSYFYSAEANEYASEKGAEYAALLERYPEGIPESEIEKFMASYDQRRGNIADPALIDAIDGFLTREIGDKMTSHASAQADSEKNYGALRKVNYSNSGNSLGNRYEVEAAYADDGGVVVTVREAEMHSTPTTVHEYRADADLIERLSDKVDECGMKEWGDLPLSEFIALDASTPSISLTFDSADPDYEFPLWLSYSRSYELPEGGWEAISSIHELMLSYATDENLIRKYEEPLR